MAERSGWFLRPGVVAQPKESFGERASRTWDGAVEAVTRRRKAASRAADERVAQLHGQLAALAQSGQELRGAASDVVARWLNSALASTSFAAELQGWLIDRFATSPACSYDRAMDAVYNATHVGGGLHRLFDGGHDLLGAWNACADAAHKSGDAFTEQVAGYLAAVWKDCVTPMGLPLGTWDKASFDGTATILADMGVSKVWLAKMVSVNAENLLGGVSGVVSVIFNWNAADSERFAEMVGSFGISSVFALNPLIGVIALVCLARAYQRARQEEAGLAHGRMLLSIGKGGIGSAVFLGTMSLLSAHVWIGLVVGLCAMMAAYQVFDRGRQAAAQVDWVGLARSVTEELSNILSRGGVRPVLA